MLCHFYRLYVWLTFSHLFNLSYYELACKTSFERCYTYAPLPNFMSPHVASRPDWPLLFILVVVDCCLAVCVLSSSSADSLLRSCDLRLRSCGVVIGVSRGHECYSLHVLCWRGKVAQLHGWKLTPSHSVLPSTMHRSGQWQCV